MTRAEETLAVYYSRLALLRILSHAPGAVATAAASSSSAAGAGIESGETISRVLDAVEPLFLANMSG